MSDIVVRPFQAKDAPTIHEMHVAMGFDYAEPDWSRMLVSAVIEEDGRPTMAAFLRKTSTVYLVLDQELRKRGKLGNFLILNRELLRPSQRMGITEVEAFLPPQLEPTFGKLLQNLGWKKNLWPCFSREVK